VVFVIRVDSSFDIGSGHVMRCMVLAENLKQKLSQVYFICREHRGSLIEYIESRGYKVFRLPNNNSVKTHINSEDEITNWLGDSQEEDALECLKITQKLKPDWLIVDHYFIDKQWELILKRNNLQLMVIDDLANREHECEVLLDQNYYISPHDRYSNLISDKCHNLLGPQFALLRKEFINCALSESQKNDSKFHIFIFMGSSDKDNQTLKAINSVISLLEKGVLLSVDVLVGSININAIEIENLCNKHSEITFFKSTNKISKLMSKANISIGAGGFSSIERCYLGLPSLVISLATNQIETTNALDSLGAICHLGWHESVDEEIIATEIKKAMNSPDQLKKMTLKALSIFHSNNGYIEIGGEYIANLMLKKSIVHKE
jgi:UDP-2,4-diacetamido-2,4,6-trideoxy-beta-L-altropyranose hydrolase